VNLLADIPPPHVQRQRYAAARRRLMGPVCREPSRRPIWRIEPDAEDEQPPADIHHTLNEIISAVCREMNLTPAELASYSRRPCFTPGRRVASYLCVTLTNQSKAAVARALGKTHHTTVSYHVMAMRGLLRRTARGYPPLRDELRIINAVDRITEQLTGEKR
jgi:hypothetical protein